MVQDKLKGIDNDLIYWASSLCKRKTAFRVDDAATDPTAISLLSRCRSYEHWDSKARVGLNTWLRREVLKYDDVRLDYAKNSHDGTAVRRAGVFFSLVPQTRSGNSLTAAVCHIQTDRHSPARALF